MRVASLAALLAGVHAAPRVHTIFCAECTNNVRTLSTPCPTDSNGAYELPVCLHHAFTTPGPLARSSAQFDYKSIGVFYSHNVSGMPGGVTRLLACDEEQLRGYKGLHIGPTLVHKNYARVCCALGLAATPPPHRHHCLPIA